MTLTPAEGFFIPRAPGRTSQTPPQARFQPVTRPLWSLEILLLFPINTLFNILQYSISICKRCQEFRGSNSKTWAKCLKMSPNYGRLLQSVRLVPG